MQVKWVNSSSVLSWIYWAMSLSSTARAAVYVGFPLPPGTSLSWTPPSSLYWTQKSVSSISAAAANRSNAASPGVISPAAKAGVPSLNSHPAPIVPAPTASDLPKKERRLIELFEGLTLSSNLSSRGRYWLLLKSFAVGLLVFIPVESQRSRSEERRVGKE